MFYVIALDLSLTGTGICVGEEAPQSGVIRTKKRGAEQLAFMREAVKSAVYQSGRCARYIFSEELPKGASKGSLQERAELVGAIRLLAYDLGVPFVEVHPSHIKIFATGRGDSSKDAMIANAIRRFEFAGSDNNEADAWLLWHLAHAVLGDEIGVSLPATHLRALEKVSL